MTGSVWVRAAALMLWTSAAAAAPCLDEPILNVLEDTVKEQFVRGCAAANVEDWGTAARAYGQVLDAEPELLQARIGLGRALVELGRYSEAERVYREIRFPDDVARHEGLGDLYMRSEDWARAEREYDALASYETNVGWPRGRQASAVLHRDPIAAADYFHDYLELDLGPGAHEPEVERGFAERTGAELYRALIDAGEPDRALDVIERLGVRYPEAVERLGELKDRARIEILARELARAAPEPLDGSQREELVRARQAFAAGSIAEAGNRLEGLASQVRANPEVLAALADVREARGQFESAEQAIRAAQALDPTEAAYSARLGEILAAHFPREAAAAIRAFDRALRQDTTRADLWLAKADLEMREARWVEARASVQQYLRGSHEGPVANRARAILAAIDRERGPAMDLPASAARPTSVPQEAWDAYWRAFATFQEPRPQDGGIDYDAALAELAIARAQAPEWVPALRLQARIHHDRAERESDADDLARAVELYGTALALEPDQPDLLVTLGLLAEAAGDHDGAMARWRTAAGLGGPGSAEAHFYLARAAAASWSLFEARDHLDAYFAGATTTVVHERAKALRGEVDGWISSFTWGGVGLGATGVVIAIGVPLGWWWRRRAGASLDVLLARAPAAYHDVARICSKLRHEVLKHNTTVLPSVADALEAGDPEPGLWAAENLFRRDGAVERFEAYVSELVVLGRRHGVRLNLAHRDPVFRPMIRAMRRLRKLESALRRGSSRRIAADLREISDALNDIGYRNLGILISRVCLLEVGDDLVHDVWEAVISEPDLRDEEVPDLELDLPRTGLWLRVFRGELFDILANVLRNNVRATIDHGGGRVGLRVEVEEDFITGLERVAFRIADDAPRRVSTAMIRSRYIDRGLGLTVDLISRNGGSIHVEDEAGWAKAVVVRLPLAEAPSEPGGG